MVVSKTPSGQKPTGSAPRPQVAGKIPSMQPKASSNPASASSPTAPFQSSASTQQGAGKKFAFTPSTEKLVLALTPPGRSIATPSQGSTGVQGASKIFNFTLSTAATAPSTPASGRNLIAPSQNSSGAQGIAKKFAFTLSTAKMVLPTTPSERCVAALSQGAGKKVTSTPSTAATASSGPLPARSPAVPSQSSTGAQGVGKKITSTPSTTATAPSAPPLARSPAAPSQSSTGAQGVVGPIVKPQPNPIQQKFFLGPPPHQVRKIPVDLIRRFTSILAGRPPHLDHALPPIRLPHATVRDFIAIESFFYACALARHQKSYALNLAAICYEIAEDTKEMEICLNIALDTLRRGGGLLVSNTAIHWGQHWYNVDRAFNSMGPPIQNAIIAHVGEYYGVYRNSWEEDREKREKREKGSEQKEAVVVRECFERDSWWWSAGFEGKRVANWATIPTDVEEVPAEEEMARWEQQLLEWENLENTKSSATKVSHLAGKKR
ncbi:hypothetical protein K440DRAFT_639012 [Wilcoxina mikolae CBS 423.85]|nr:hypothetical protein K440DRAFT_639012 [Wilcoxina mikolae CBS 423.85]